MTPAKPIEIKSDVPEVEELNLIDLTLEQKSGLDTIAQTFVDSFENKGMKQTAVKYINMPFNQICNSPKDEKWRSVVLTNRLFKPVIDANQKAVENLLNSIGFTKVSQKYIF